MCRHLAYLGPPITLSRLLYDPPHSLVRQASAPRDMRAGGTINADGFGIGWYPGPDDQPRRYRGVQPMWTDPELPRLAADIAAGAVLAAVRSATAGMPVTHTACAPFTGDGWLFSLNGRIAGWPESVAPLAGRLPVTELLTMEAPTDSVLLWTLLRSRLRAGAPPAEAVAATVADVLATAPGSRLNLLLAGPHTVVASTVTHSLSVRHDGGSTLVSSEPLDTAPDWRPVPDGYLLTATATQLDLSPLPTS
jgi:glutamine amidotransferase